MSRLRWRAAASAWVALACPLIHAEITDPRFREVTYDAHKVVTVHVQRGLPTLLQLVADEAISDIGVGLGSDCKNLGDPWCIAAQPGGRIVLVKPKSGASAPNNVVVLTNQRVHTFRFVVLADADPRPPVYGMAVKLPAPARAVSPGIASRTPFLWLPPLPLPEPVPSERVVAERLQAKPQVKNAHYSLAEGPKSQDIVPSLVFDDGRFTYLRFAGNREVPAAFHVLGDGSETLANARMEDDLLVIDRVSRRLMLRAGNAVVGIWNEAFDVDGVPPEQGTTVPGVQRVLKAAPGGRVGANEGVRP